MEMVETPPDIAIGLAEVLSQGMTEEEMIAALIRCSKEGPVTLIEFATSENSALGRAGEKKGVKVIRLTKERSDLSTLAGLRDAVRVAKENPGAHLWISIPCTPWCAWHHVNKARYGEEYSKILKGQRKVNLRMLRHAKIVADIVQQNG